jgi:hypothetical protein
MCARQVFSRVMICTDFALLVDVEVKAIREMRHA